MLDLLISTAHAQEGAPPAGGGGAFTLLMFGSIIAIWWFLVIRPQTRQQQRHRAMVAALKRGDQVVTSSGMLGKIAAVEDDAVTLEVAKGVKVRFLKDKIANTRTPGGTAKATEGDEAANDVKKKKK